jgi:hypothetical protein
MRLTGLLALLLFILIIFFAAPAASYAQTANAPAATADRPAPGAVAILPGNPQQDRNRHAPYDGMLYLRQPLIEHDGDLVLRGGDRDFERDGVCYTMRTYVMAREDKSSDVTHRVRYTRCTPAWKVEFKTADERTGRSTNTKPEFAKPE